MTVDVIQARAAQAAAAQKLFLEIFKDVYAELVPLYVLSESTKARAAAHMVGEDEMQAEMKLDFTMPAEQAKAAAQQAMLTLEIWERK